MTSCNAVTIAFTLVRVQSPSVCALGTIKGKIKDPSLTDAHHAAGFIFFVNTSASCLSVGTQ